MKTADYSTISQIQDRLIEASDALDGMAEDVAKARQIREYDSDRRKRALSCAVMDFLKTGESATAAEHKARASESYADMMKARGKELEVAETIIAKWDAVKIKWQTAQSLLSMHKSLVTNL